MLPESTLRRLTLARLLVSVFVATHCHQLLMEAQAADGPFDCSSTLARTSLSDYDIYCPYITKWDESYLKMNLINRLDIVESCACNLLDKSVVWEAMLTHELECMYHALKDTVLEESSRDATSIATSSMLADADFTSNNRTFMWDLIDGALNERPARTDGIHLSRKFEEKLSQVYYDPNTLERSFKDDLESTQMRLMIFDQCQWIDSTFKPFQDFFENIGKLSENHRLIYRVVDKFPTIYKLMSAAKICNYLQTAEELIK